VNGEGDSARSLPDPSARMLVSQVSAPHPATMPSDVLLAQCALRTQRRSGPGGQHRNKTSSGVFLQHEPTEIVAEATERRSQAANRSVALSRLRLKLAVELRSPAVFDEEPTGFEAALRKTYRRRDLRISERNADYAAVLALLLNDLHASGGIPSMVATQWRTTTSAMLRLLRSHPPAFALVNDIRKFHGRRRLR